MATYNLGRILPIFKGTWDDSIEYKRLDVVYWTTSSWVALSDNSNSEPTENNNNWLCIAKGSSNYSEWSEQDKTAIYNDFIQYFEAPENHKNYTRIDGDWVALQEFPTTSTTTGLYLTGINNSGAAVKISSDNIKGEVREAPTDGKSYSRSNGAWVETSDNLLRTKLEYDPDFADEVIFTNSQLVTPYSMPAGVQQSIKVSSEQTFGNLSLIANYSDNTWVAMTNTRYTNTELEFTFTPTKEVVSIGTNYAYLPSSTPWSVKYEILNPDLARIVDIEKSIEDFAPVKETLDDLVTKQKLTPDSYILDSYFDEAQHNLVSSSVTAGYKLAVYNVAGGMRLSYKATSAIGNYNYLTVVDALGNEVQHVIGNYVNDKEGDITLVENANKVYLQILRPNKDENDYGVWQSFIDTLEIATPTTEDDAYVHSAKDYIIGSASNNDGYNFMPTETPAFLIIGQSNADGRIPNASFPANITMDGETITMNKQIPTCMFRYGTLGGYTDQYYTSQKSWNSFAARDNNNLWAFDDILYNLFARQLGNKPFYVVKCTMGATGLQNPTLQTMAIYSWNANLQDFKTKPTGKDGSMAMVTRLNCQQAFEVLPTLAFKGIFMHQGENDCRRLTGRKKGTYFSDLADLIDFCRTAVKNQDCPFIFGSVPTNSRDYDEMIYHDQQMIQEKIHNCHLITMGAASGWVNDGMNVHFLAPDAVNLAINMYKTYNDNYSIS